MRTVMAKCALGIIMSIPLGIVGMTAAAGPTSAASNTPQSRSNTTQQVAEAPPPPAPDGCFAGYYCSYNQGNGGSLCWTTSGSANLSSGCADHNDSGYNDSSAVTNLHYCFGYECAYYALGAGDYLLYMTENTFYSCANNNYANRCVGLNIEVGYNLASVYFD